MTSDLRAVLAEVRVETSAIALNTAKTARFLERALDAGVSVRTGDLSAVAAEVAPTDTCPCGDGELIAFRFVESDRDLYTCRPSSGACPLPNPERAEALRALSRGPSVTASASANESSAACSLHCSSTFPASH